MIAAIRRFFAETKKQRARAYRKYIREADRTYYTWKRYEPRDFSSQFFHSATRR